MTQVEQPAEATRLRALRSLNLLDTPPEERFDRISRLAQELFDVPMVSLTLLDEDRQFRKSEIGLGSQVAPLEGAFCAVTVRERGPVLVEDALLDERFVTNPFVVDEPQVRFYAGYPLEAPGGETVGAFCIIDKVPRTLTGEQQRILSDLAQWVQGELARDEEQDRARTVQRGLLPKPLPNLPGYEVRAEYLPARTVGGDFYDWSSDGRELTFTLADVMGKGTGAAILAATTRAVFRGVGRMPDLAEAIQQVADAMQGDLEEVGAFVTAFHGKLDLASGRLRYVDAGHNLAIVLQADGAVRRTTPGTLPLGVPWPEAVAESSLVLAPGERFVCFSDGLFDLLGGVEDSIGEIAALFSLDRSIESAMRGIDERLTVDIALDDVTVLAIDRAS